MIIDDVFSHHRLDKNIIQFRKLLHYEILFLFVHADNLIFPFMPAIEFFVDDLLAFACF